MMANESEKNIKYGIQLSEEQKLAKALILENKVNFVTGKAASGKTALCCQIALDLFFKKKIDKIIITRPTIDMGQSLGALPGEINSKMSPYLQPIYQNFYRLYKKDKIDKMIDEGKIEVVPFQFMRGITFTSSAVIVDEVQNTTIEQIATCLERLGIGSKLMLVGDINQLDLQKQMSGIKYLEFINEKNIHEFCKITLTSNYRDPIVEALLRCRDEFNQKK